MTTTTRLLGIVVTFLCCLTAFASEGENFPRYRFHPGQELAFRSSSEFKYGEGKSAGEHGDQADSTAWVLRANKDGSFHVVLRQKSAFSQTSEGKKHTQPAQTSVAYADIFPDGRVLMNKTIQYRGHPGALFPKLPRDAEEAKIGWVSEKDDEKTTYKRLDTSKEFVFEGVRHSPMNKIYLSSNMSKYTFDMVKGFVTRADTASTQGYGFKGKGTGKIELVSLKEMEPAEVQALADASDKYFAAVGAYDELTDAAEKSPKEAKALLDQALEKLKAASATIKNEEMKANLTEKINGHAGMEKYFLDGAQRRAKIVGKPGAEFETTDIEGKKVKLADLRGKVVVLDFWYRGCGWCIKAMPQMNQLAEDFAGKPVAIFGMNTDRNQEDAKFVIKEMALKYPTLKAEGLPEKFGVQGFPTLIVIDQQGKVYDIHVGYSPTLREEVGKQIRTLLAGK